MLNNNYYIYVNEKKDFIGMINLIYIIFNYLLF